MGASEIFTIILLGEILLKFYWIETWKNYKATELKYMFGEIQT